MAAAPTTLPLFWHLASADKSERIDSSVKLISALEEFQERHKLETTKSRGHSSDKEIEKDSTESESDGNEDKPDTDFKSCSAKLDSDNAPDVAYAIRRLIRGLASPRESSRLGFAVALTELLSHIDTVSCEQILVLLKNASQTTGSMSGQEERDMLFARLFGLKSIVQSDLLFNQQPLKSSSTTSSSLKGFESFLTELLQLGEKKSWLRESCWWTLTSAVNSLSETRIPWKEEAYELLFDRIYVKDKTWSPEKVALTIKLQKMRPEADWDTLCASYFKSPSILSTSNLPLLGRLLKESITEGQADDEASKHTVSPWRPQLHFVWDVILESLLSAETFSSTAGSFQDFYRIVVDETLFALSSSPQRKYWGFLVFQKALHRVPAEHLPMLFTKNFMRTWINQLAKNDRYLHKIARQIASDVQQVVEKDPKVGFTLVLQLTGTNGSLQFDRITKTKTVETILSRTDSAGVKEYIGHLLKNINEGQDDSLASVDSRRSWIIEQVATLIRKGSIPKTDEDVKTMLDWLATHAFFEVIKKSSKNTNIALHQIPEPPFSDGLRNACKSKLLSSLGDLTNTLATIEVLENKKSVKLPGVASDGEFWISKVLKTIAEQEKDSKHVSLVYHLDEDKMKTRTRVFSLIDKIKIRASDPEAVRGAELLLSGSTLKCLCDGGAEAEWEDIMECMDQFTKLFASAASSQKKGRKESNKANGDDEAERSPIDLVVDVIIGLLEHSTNFTRIIADQSFSMLTSMVADSTVDLILTQLERRDPTEEEMDPDTENGGSSDSERTSDVDSDGESDDESVTTPTSDEEEIAKEEDTEALRKALRVAISGEEAISDADGLEGSSDEEVMDDERMMAIDEKLAAVFRSRAQERNKGKDTGAQREATYFKNRVLDLVEIYMKRQPSNPLVLRFILPLVELVATASSDEKQLSDKAKGILRSRLSKTKDATPISETSKGVEILESLHLRARRAHSQDIVSIISMCSLFIAKALISANEKAVLHTYKESTIDFVTRKASSLNTAFITDFIRRHPLSAWKIRSDVIAVLHEAVNGFRQVQTFSILQILLTSLPQPESKKDDIASFVGEVSRIFLNALNKSCASEKPPMNSAHMKQALKVAMSICRFSRRYAIDSTAFEKAWRPEEWESLASALSTSENFKASTSLPNACHQIVKFVLSDSSKTGETSSKSIGIGKRKSDAEDRGNIEDEVVTRKPKRKKVRKAPNGSSS